VTDASRPNWFGFSLVCAGYLAVTVGEQLLSPLYPTASNDLGLSVAQGGIAFGILTAAIAVANLIGGFAVRRLGATGLIRLSCVVTALGSVAAATASGYPTLVAAQVLLGAGAGLFFPAGLQAVAILAGPHRKGLAMGIYGVAFSGGLTLAAVLGALGASTGWRSAFWIGGALAALGGLASGGLRLTRPGASATTGPMAWGRILSLPTTVGSMGAICQYGAVPYLTLFAVTTWGLSTAAAASVLAVGRVISILAKLISGVSADRVGPYVSAQRTGVLLMATGLGWTLLPAGLFTYAIAAVFAGTVSSLFPIANLLAVDRFRSDGRLLGAYRSAQIAIGALVGATAGLLGDGLGLRPVLVVIVASPVALVWLCREPSLQTSAAP
jgi:predicted MFS family arabinose efflux permease